MSQVSMAEKCGSECAHYATQCQRTFGQLHLSSARSERHVNMANG